MGSGLGLELGLGLGLGLGVHRVGGPAWSRLSRASGLGPRPDEDGRDAGLEEDGLEEDGRPKLASEPSELSRDRERACMPDEPIDLDAEISSLVEMLISSSTDSIE